MCSASVMVGALLGVFDGAAGASAKCVPRYRDLALPVYDRRVTVYHYHHLSCGAAARVASATSDAYERGLPLADYPPAPPRFVSGQGRTFKVHTRKHGTYTCRVTMRGSDFIQARCRRGVWFSSFVVEEHWWLHGQ